MADDGDDPATSGARRRRERAQSTRMMAATAHSVLTEALKRSQQQASDPFEAPAVEPMVHPWCECSQSPLLVVKWPASMERGELDHYFDVAQAWIANIKTPFGVIYDFVEFNASDSTPGARSTFAERAKQISPQLKAQCAGLATIVRTAAMSRVITAVTWLIEPPCPVRHFDNAALAESWVREQVKDTWVQRL